MRLPSIMGSILTGGFDTSRSHSSWWTVWKYHLSAPVSRPTDMMLSVQSFFPADEPDSGYSFPVPKYTRPS